MTRDSVATSPRPGAATILVIDDNQSVRTLVRRALRNAGYHVMDWGDPQAAIDHLSLTQDLVSLAIVDGVMPRMLGPEVADEIHRLRPGAPILLMSGHEAPMFSEFFGKPGHHFIAKPFVIEDLVGRVSAIAGKPSA